MILFEQESRILIDALVARFKDLEKPAELDSHLVEFDDVRYHVQAAATDSQHITVSIGLPVAPAGAAVAGGLGGSILPLGALEAVEEAYGAYAKVLDEPEAGFDLTLRIETAKILTEDGTAQKAIRSLASLRSTIMAAPLRNILKKLSEGVGPGSPQTAASVLTALLYRPKEVFYVTKDAEKATVVFPMNFQDSNDVTLASSFLQEFMEARRTASAQTAPFCSYSKSPPLELKSIPASALKANAGYVSFVIFPRHVQGDKLGRTAWALLTFYAYVSYHIKCSKAFMHTRMRRRVEGLIQVLNKAKPELIKEKKTASGKTFVRPV